MYLFSPILTLCICDNIFLSDNSISFTTPGPPLIHLNFDMGNGDVHIYIVHKFLYDGWVTSWIVYTYAAGSFYIDVWRPEGGTYKLIGMNLITVDGQGIHVCRNHVNVTVKLQCMLNTCTKWTMNGRPLQAYNREIIDQCAKAKVINILLVSFHWFPSQHIT